MKTKKVKWLIFCPMLGCSVALTVSLWDYILVTKIPLLFIALSVCCSILYLLNSKSKIIIGVTYFIFAVILLIGIIYFAYYRRPMGLLPMISSIITLIKWLLADRKSPKHKITKLVWTVTVMIAIIFIVMILIELCIAYHSPYSNGKTCLWGKSDEVLFDSICQNATTDEEIIKTAYNFTMDCVDYDYDCNPHYQYFDIHKTLKTHKGLCFDYANLFAAVCRSQNVPCFVLDGYRKTDCTSLHTWNRVYFNNTWYNVDVTFDDCTKGPKYGFHKIDNYNSPDKLYCIERIY